MAIPPQGPLPDERATLDAAEAQAALPATVNTSKFRGPLYQAAAALPQPGAAMQDYNKAWDAQAATGQMGFAPPAPAAATAPPPPAGPPAPPPPAPAGDVQVGPITPTPEQPPQPQVVSQKVSYSGPTDQYAQHQKEFQALQGEGDALADQGEALRKSAAEAAAKLKDSAVIEGQRRSDEFDKSYQAARDHMAALGQKRDALIDQLSRYELDPDKYFKSQNAAQNFNTGMGLLVGSMLQGGGFTADNPAMTQLNNAINRQIDADKIALSTRLKALEGLSDAQKIEMLDSAEVRVMQGARREAYWDMVSRRMDAEAAKRGVDQSSKNWEIAKNTIAQQRKLAEIATDRARIQAAIDAANKRAAQERADRLKALELALQKGKDSEGQSNVIMDQGAFLGAIQGKPRMVKDAQGNLIPMPLPIIEKGGGGSLANMWKTSPEQASKQQLLAVQSAVAKNALDRYVELQKKSFMGATLNPKESKEKDNLEAIIASAAKGANEGSDADQELRARRNTPSFWLDDKQRIDFLNRMHATLDAPLSPEAKEFANLEYKRLSNARATGQ